MDPATPSSSQVLWRDEMVVKECSDPRTLKVLTSAIGGVGPRSDWYHWARGEGLYITREALLERMDAQGGGAGEHLIVVDVRDDDAIGGHIKGAIHLPDCEFGAQSIASLLERARILSHGEQAEQAEPAVPVLVVLHCMESARRAPRCARRIACALDALVTEGLLLEPSPGARPIDVRVLEGGFDQYARRFWADPGRVADYDDDYWGLKELEDIRRENEREEVTQPTPSSSADAALPSHVLYERPADQPATPWSAAGSEGTGNER